jgi:hypothetical protein
MKSGSTGQAAIEKTHPRTAQTDVEQTRPYAAQAKCVTVGNWPLFLLVAQDSVECGGPSFDWLRQTQQNRFSSQEFVK